MAGPDIGVRVTCPGCGTTVLQKAMIPVARVADGGTRVGYLCVDCARRHVDIKPDAAAATDSEASDSEASDSDVVDGEVVDGEVVDGDAAEEDPASV